MQRCVSFLLSLHPVHFHTDPLLQESRIPSDTSEYSFHPQHQLFFLTFFTHFFSYAGKHLHRFILCNISSPRPGCLPTQGGAQPCFFTHGAPRPGRGLCGAQGGPLVFQMVLLLTPNTTRSRRTVAPGTGAM